MPEADIDYRTWGATRTCKGCRYWSEMVAQSVGGGPVQAMCLSALSPARGKYMGPNRTCTEWQSGELGAHRPAGRQPLRSLTMRQVHAHHVEDELAFAREAGAAFAADPKLTSYTGHEIAPGVPLALRWGLGRDCVLVLKLDEAHEPTIYAQIVPGNEKKREAPVYVVVTDTDGCDPADGTGQTRGPLALETYFHQATLADARQRATAMEKNYPRHGRCRVARLVFEDHPAFKED